MSFSPGRATLHGPCPVRLVALGRNCTAHQTIHDLFSPLVILALLLVSSPLSLLRTLFLTESLLRLRESVRHLVLQLLIAEELEPSIFEDPGQVPDISVLFCQNVGQLMGI